MKLPKFYLRRIWRTIMEFEMLEKGDKVVVGLSGGKDSLFLLYALKVIQTNSKFPLNWLQPQSIWVLARSMNHISGSTAKDFLCPSTWKRQILQLS